MKYPRKKAPTEFDIHHRDGLSALQQRGKFKYVDRYEVGRSLGKERKSFKRMMDTPVFLALQQKYINPPVKVAQIAVLGKQGLGVIATQDIILKKNQKTKNLGIYWGKLLREGEENSAYVFVVSKYEVDALRYGNWTRFVNHSKCNFNVIACQKTCVVGKVRLPYMVYALTKNVKAGEQLLVDYGPEYDFDKKHQLFLNPSNGSVPMAILFRLNKNQYSPIRGKLLMICRELMPNHDHFFGPTPYLDTQRLSLTRHKKQFFQDVSIDSAILAADKRGNILADALQSGITVAMLAAYMGNYSALQTLIKVFHANIEQQNLHNGYTTLFYAILSRAHLRIKKRMVTFLLSLHVTLSTQDIDGLTILHLTVAQKDLSLLKLFFSNKKIQSEVMESLDLLDRENRCPITYAISIGEIKLAKYLLNTFREYYGAVLFVSNQNDWFIPLITKIIQHYSYQNQPQMITLLMNNGLANNGKALRALMPIFKRKGYEIQFIRKRASIQMKVIFKDQTQCTYHLNAHTFKLLFIDSK